MFTEFFNWIFGLEFNYTILHRWASELPGLEIVMFAWTIVVLTGACGFAYAAFVLHQSHDAKQRKLYPFDAAGGPDTEQDTVPSFKTTIDTAKRDAQRKQSQFAAAAALNKTYGKFGTGSNAYYGLDAKGKAIAPEGDYICRGDRSVTRHNALGTTVIRDGELSWSLGRLVSDTEIVSFLNEGTVPHS